MTSRYLASCLLGTASVLATLPGLAQGPWTDSVTVGTRLNATTVLPTQFKVWVPTGVTAPKGIILASSATNSRLTRSMPFAMQAAIRQTAATEQLVIVSFFPSVADTGMAISFDPTLQHGDSLTRALTRLGQRLNVANMATLPVISFGHGKGARFAQEYGMFAPTTTAAVISYHPFGISSPAWRNSAPYSPTANSLRTVPHAIISAELEGPEINNNARIFYADTMRTRTLQARAQGALAHQVLEMNGSHRFVDPRGMQYLGVFISKTVALRISAGGTVNTLAENTGVLGRATNPYTFERTSYFAEPFNQGQAASRHWLYDAAHGEAWVSFHQTPIRIEVQPPALSVAPYVSGRNPSGVAVTYDLLNRSFGAVFGDTNIVRVEMSNAWGDFNDEEYPALIQGSTLRRDTTGFTSASAAGNLAGFLEAALSNNLQYDRITFGTNPRPRYRFRLVTTDPPMQSHNTGEVSEWIYGDRQNMWLSALPGGTRLQRGRDIRLTLNKQASFTLGAGNRFTIQLSDSAGMFDNATIIGDTLATMSGNTLVLRGTIPTNALVGYKYRIRVKSSAPLDSSGNNGGDLMLGSIITGLDNALRPAAPASALKVFPNPATDVATVLLDMPQAGTAHYSLLRLNGETVAAGNWTKAAGTEQQSLSLSSLPSGVYILKVKIGQELKVAKVLKY